MSIHRLAFKQTHAVDELFRGQSTRAPVLLNYAAARKLERAQLSRLRLFLLPKRKQHDAQLPDLRAPLCQHRHADAVASGWVGVVGGSIPG